MGAKDTGQQTFPTHPAARVLFSTLEVPSRWTVLRHPSASLYSLSSSSTELERTPFAPDHDHPLLILSTLHPNIRKTNTPRAHLWTGNGGKDQNAVVSVASGASISSRTLGDVRDPTNFARLDSKGSGVCVHFSFDLTSRVVWVCCKILGYKEVNRSSLFRRAV